MPRLRFLLSSLLVLSTSLFLTTAALAQEHDHGPSTVHLAKPAKPIDMKIARGKIVSFPSAVAGNASGYLALPSGKAGTKYPALVVIQEWWGMNEWVMQQTDRFANAGYVAIAVDLYRGKSTTDPNEAHELMRGMPEGRAVADLKAAYEYLASRADVDSTKIGSIGWCMGGGFSLELALAEPHLAACVMNYGRLVSDPATIAKINTPILGNFGADDRGIPADDVKTFEATLRKDGKEADMKVYAGAGHGFMNPNNKDGYRADATQDAWHRIDDFFAKKLK